MTLADTSIWIAHFRAAIPEFGVVLKAGEVCIHPVVIGELAMANLKGRAETLTMLTALPSVTIASDKECLELVEQHWLFGRGIGWSDVQLLAAAKLSGTPLWSLDRRLNEVAATLAIAYSSR